MHYKKYDVLSPLFALRDPRLSEEVLAAFSGTTVRPALPPAQRNAHSAPAKEQQR
jgi:hypothetical protein